jgi:hypothetical protein
MGLPMTGLMLFLNLRWMGPRDLTRSPIPKSKTTPPNSRRSSAAASTATAR